MNPGGYCIVLIYPERFVFVEAFREIIEMLQADFAALGLHVPAFTNQLPSDGTTPILFGSHLLLPDSANALPTQTILYNAEHLVPSNTQIPDLYYQLLSRLEVWDFSSRNTEFIRTRLNNPRAYHLPIAYSPVMSRVLPGNEDIDVLFYGIGNERRQHVIDDLGKAGVKVQVLNGTFGAERDNHIARAKVVLNVHFNPDVAFEAVRVIPLLANRKAVVCEECSADLPPDLREGMKVVPYEQLAAACIELLHNEAARNALASRGFQAVTSQMPSGASYLASRLGTTFKENKATGTSLPRVLMAGCGKRTSSGFLNADIRPLQNVDWGVDFGRPLPFDEPANFGRYGSVTPQPEMFDAIIAHHLLEHIPDLVTAMTNFLKLLRAGGCFHIEVPYDLSHGAWQDPTHVRAFNERSWSYFTEHHDYLGWRDARFDLVNLTFLLSPLGRQLRSQGRLDEELLRTPRAVDSMRIALIKRSLDVAIPDSISPGEAS
jgi:SAM-dependent methyltransferase